MYERTKMISIFFSIRFHTKLKFIHSLTHSVTHSFGHSLGRSFAHSLIRINKPNYVMPPKLKIKAPPVIVSEAPAAVAAPSCPSPAAPSCATPSCSQFLASLSPLEQRVCAIAESHLESSFDLSRSSGYIAWKAKNVS